MKTRITVQLQEKTEGKNQALAVFNSTVHEPIVGFLLVEINAVLNTMTFEFLW